MKYAGIGARKTPDDIQVLMFKIAEKLASKGYVLRSGGAEGADMAFQRGCEVWCDNNNVPYNQRQEIYLPWDNFNGLTVNESEGITVDQHWLAMEIASEYHPTFDSLSETAKKLMSRNTSQVHGNSGSNEDVEFVICWTPDGANKKTTQTTGGTGQAIRLAVASGIPVINLKNQQDLLWVEELLAD